MRRDACRERVDFTKAPFGSTPNRCIGRASARAPERVLRDGRDCPRLDCRMSGKRGAHALDNVYWDWRWIRFHEPGPRR